MFAGIERGSPAYRRASLALFLAGFATFSLLYCVQPLLPEFARDYRISPTASSMALSLTTGALAVSILVSGAVSQGLPRRGLMFASMLLAGLCNLLAALAPNWSLLLAARFCEGLVLGGVPAVAMAWLAEEIHPRDLGKAMGLYVAGTAFGGMMGRVGMGLLVEWESWRLAMATLGALGLASALGFAVLLPPSRRFVAASALGLGHHVRVWSSHLRHRDLPRLFAIGFLLTSVFVTLFNYAGFRLSAPPFRLGPTAISLIFLSYISGMFASPWAGQLADRFGRRRPLTGSLALMVTGSLITLSVSLPVVAIGILLVTIGFFGAHAVASGWVGRLAGDAKGHASSLYLLSYYMGSSFVGSAGGWFWQAHGWAGVVGLTSVLAALAVGLALSLGGAARG
ncbi:MFS family transporter [Novosphingobium nitrogenifigens DSM 19370]|uniref:MFS family transporter n=1 Tax=Novosphingobium nitrogenifigens DSM 19370 TaxID=983920 RepID=F1Z808_9SPHN|nr:MFS family transporter [Novosphingobium nitrogenifigens DSM 19370]